MAKALAKYEHQDDELKGRDVARDFETAFIHAIYCCESESKTSERNVVATKFQLAIDEVLV